MTYYLIIDGIFKESCRDYKDMQLKAWACRLGGHKVEEVIVK